MKEFIQYLDGNDLRSIGKNNKILKLINSQKDFDELFEYLYSKNRAIKMKTIDIIEKITVKDNTYLKKHKSKVLALIIDNENIEFKWHLAQLLPRLEYNEDEIEFIWGILKQWVMNIKESKIVRVNSLQSLFDLRKNNSKFEVEFKEIIQKLEKENVSSINARIKKLRL